MTDLEFATTKKEFVNAAGTIARLLTHRKKDMTEAFAVRIAANDSLVTLAANTTEIAGNAHLPAQVATPGEVEVDGKELAKLARKLPDGKVTVHAEGGIVELRSGEVTEHLKELGGEFFYARRVNTENWSLLDNIDARELRTAIEQTRVAASQDRTLPMIQSVHVNVAGGSMEFAATDRFRMARHTVRWWANDSEMEGEMLVNADAARKVAKFLGSRPNGEVELVYGTSDEFPAGAVGIQYKNMEVIVPRLQFEFPDVWALMPSTSTTVVTVDRAQLAAAANQALEVDKELPRVELTIRDGEVTAARHSQSDQFEASIPATMRGKELTIAFNAAYLAEGLESLTDERVTIGLNQPNNPALFVPNFDRELTDDGDGTFAGLSTTDHAYLLMPLRPVS